jgi:putative ABC transport system permease protein
MVFDQAGNARKSVVGRSRRLGVALGGLASIAVARLLAAGLAGLGSMSPVTFVAVPILLVLVTLAACYIPARRASLVDPMVALRYE